MAFASLMRLGTTPAERAAFSFEHAMAHRTLFGAMSPLDRFSVLPYLIDPTQSGGKWLLNHQQAHWDFQSALPSYFEATETGGLGLTNDPILIAPDLESPWSIFANMIAHNNAMSAMPEAASQTYPFW